LAHASLSISGLLSDRVFASLRHSYCNPVGGHDVGWLKRQKPSRVPDGVWAAKRSTRPIKIKVRESTALRLRERQPCDFQICDGGLDTGRRRSTRLEFWIKTIIECRDADDLAKGHGARDAQSHRPVDRIVKRRNRKRRLVRTCIIICQPIVLRLFNFLACYAYII